jgi:predicted RNase H-like HicB family nuclease
MARHIRIKGAKRKKPEPRDLTFTVIYLPVDDTEGSSRSRGKKPTQGATVVNNSMRTTGYQVTVPLLPGLVTYGRNIAEAQEMARDAIECHIEGLCKSATPTCKGGS